MRKKIIKEKLHRMIWRIFFAILGLFLIIFFFGAYIFFGNDTDYTQRNFGKQTQIKQN